MLYAHKIWQKLCNSYAILNYFETIFGELFKSWDKGRRTQRHQLQTGAEYRPNSVTKVVIFKFLMKYSQIDTKIDLLSIG